MYMFLLLLKYIEKQQQLVHKLQNAPSEEQSRERNNKELQKRVLEKVGEDLKYKVCRNQSCSLLIEQFKIDVVINLGLTGVDVESFQDLSDHR